MRAFITTVAGMATRFCEDLPSPIPKCIYTTDGYEQTLLYRWITMVSDYDKIVIVGGFMFGKLEAFVDSCFPEFLRKKILLINNREYAAYGSGWSLYLGIKALLDDGNDYAEILFAEGDLFISRRDFRSVTDSQKDVITLSPEPIPAKKAVALYFDVNGVPHYIYDTRHGALCIGEPFVSIYNSGQVWKFADVPYLKSVFVKIGADTQKGTNLVLINEYFSHPSQRRTETKLISLNIWVNTNTVKDYEQLVFD